MIQRIIDFFKPRCRAIGTYLIDDSKQRCQLKKEHESTHYATFPHSGKMAILIWRDK